MVLSTTTSHWKCFLILNFRRICKMNFSTPKLMLRALLLSIALIFAACGGGATGGAPGATAAGQLTFSVGGTVTGLSGKVVLQDNLGDNLSITANGPFTFATKVADGSAYNVTVLTQPTGLTCSVSSGGGTIASSNVGNVAVVCSKDAYNIGGTVSGLTGTVLLQDNNGDKLTVSANGPFTFANKVAYGSLYSVSVVTQPSGQTCSVSTGAGTVATSDVNGVSVFCSSNAYTVGGTVTGLTGFMVLQDNSGDNLIVGSNGPFTFAKPVASGSPYSVTVLTQPAGQTCTVNTGAGTVSASNVNNAAVACSTNTYTIGGTVSGLTGSVVLQDNNGDNLTVAADGLFTFAAKVAYGNPYSVSVLTQPTGQTCSVSTGVGTVPSSNVSNVAVVCSINAYTVGGVVTGLTGTVVLQDNNGDNLAAANGAFTFATKVAYGSPYSVTVLTHPTGQGCSVANGTGTMGAANVANVTITCANLNQMGGAMQGAALNLVPTVSTLAAGFNNSAGITSDGANLYVADTYNNMIRKIVIATGVVTTLAGTGVAGATDGAGAVATFWFPQGITTDGTNLYVADTNSNKIRKIVIATGVVSSFTGVANTAGAIGAADGAGTSATFHYPDSISTDGANLYVADMYNNKIRKIVIATGVVSSFTGAANTAGAYGSADGAGATATFNTPDGITTDGTNLYLADYMNNKIRKIVIATGVVSSLTGAANTAGVAGAADGAGTAATFNYPSGITTDGTNLYVSDAGNNKIRKIVIATGVVSSLTGTVNTAGAVGAADGAGATATFWQPIGITSDGSSLFVADFGNNIIRKIQ
jgi:sugar lactone lactonase YvrE